MKAAAPEPSLQPLLEADRRCLDAAELLLDTVDLLPSPASLRRFLAEVEAARRAAGEAAASSPFEARLLRHLLASWGALEEVVRHRFEHPRRPVAQLLDAVVGAGALERLEAALAAADPEAVGDYLAARQRFRADRIPPGTPEVRPLLEKAAAEAAAALRAWVAGREGDLPGMDAEVVLGRGDADRSWYEPARHRVVLGPGEFMVFEKGGRIDVNPVVALQGLAHELAGHAVQDALSRGLPDPLRPDHRGRLRFASLPVAEGFAHHRAALALAVAEERGAELGIGEDGIDLLRRTISMSWLHYAVPACAGALAARERQEPGFDALARLEAVSGHGGFGEVLRRCAADPLNRVVYNAACYFGWREVTEAAADLARRGLSGAGAVRRLGTGAWALACYREAVAA